MRRNSNSPEYYYRNDRGLEWFIFDRGEQNVKIKRKFKSNLSQKVPNKKSYKLKTGLSLLN